MEPKFTPKIETPQSSTENLSETKEKIHEMYYTRQPQSDFSKMGDLKLIDGKIFFVDKHSHQTREHGNSRDILIVLNNQMKELFRFDGERHMEFDNIETKRSDKNWSKPENQFVEIVGVKDGALEVLNGKGETITIKLPKKVLEGKI